MFRSWISTRTSTDIKRPPGPSGLPIIGSLLEARRDPLDFALRTTRRYGDISYYKIGPYTGYLLNRPDYIRHVLQSNRRNYTKNNYNYEKLKPVIGEGLITNTGESWRRQRRLIQPVFHRARGARFGGITVDSTVELFRRWDSIVEADRTIDVADEMMKLTLQVIARALFGVDIREEAQTIAENFAIVNEDISYRFRTVLVPPLWVPTQRSRNVKQARSQLDRVVYKIIARRRQNRRRRHEDLLDILLADEEMSDKQLRDEVMTLLLAGHETTASLLTWTWYLLSQHPAVAHNLRAELNEVVGERLPSVEDLSSLTYTGMILQEAMRLYPPVWIISRTAANDDLIGGFQIPSGSVVTLIPYTMHRHPEYWKNPGTFDPERFSSRREKNRSRYAYFPFGGGPRLCIGRSFAMIEAQLIVAILAQRYRFLLGPDHSVEPEPLITLRPRRELTMTLQPAEK